MSVPAENLPEESGDLRATLADAVQSVTSAPQDEKPRDDSGRFVATKADEQPTEEVTKTGLEPEAPEQVAAEETVDQAPQVDQQDNTAPPSSWKGAAKLKWADVPSEVRAEILRRENEFRTTVGKQDEQRLLGKRVQDVVTPYMPHMQQEGVTPEKLVSDVLQTAFSLSNSNEEKRAEMFARMVQQYPADHRHLIYYLSQMGGVDLGELDQIIKQQQGRAAPQQQSAPPAVDPNQIQQLLQQATDPLRQQVTQLQSAWQTREQAERQRQQDYATSIVREFESEAAKGPSGKFPFYTDVKETMRHFLQTGQASSLEDAYDKACYFDPNVRSQVLQYQESERKKAEADKAKQLAEQRKREAAEKASRAKHAMSVTGAPGSIPALGPQSDDLREQLLEGFKAMGMPM